VWTYRTGDGGGSVGRVFDKREAGAEVELLRVFTTNYLFARRWSGGLAEWTVAIPAVNEWHHIAITYDSGSTSNDPVIYIDGSSVSVTELSAPSGTLTDNSDAYIIGNRGAADRNWAGRLAEFAVWNRILNAREIASVYRSGPLAIPDHVEYLPIWGTHSSEPEFRATTSAAATVTGTVAVNHAPVVPFSRRLWTPSPFEGEIPSPPVTARRMTLLGVG
jgi:hypothetical protein